MYWHLRKMKWYIKIKVKNLACFMFSVQTASAVSDVGYQHRHHHFGQTVVTQVEGRKGGAESRKTESP